MGEIALRPSVRIQLLARTRKLVGEGFLTLTTHLNKHPGVFSVVPPMASALSFVRYNLPLNSTDFVHKLRKEKSILMVPGDCFDLDGHLRISSALPEAYLTKGLSRMNEVVADILY